MASPCGLASMYIIYPCSEAKYKDMEWICAAQQKGRGNQSAAFLGGLYVIRTKPTSHPFGQNQRPRKEIASDLQDAHHHGPSEFSSGSIVSTSVGFLRTGIAP